MYPARSRPCVVGLPNSRSAPRMLRIVVAKSRIHSPRAASSPCSRWVRSSATHSSPVEAIHVSVSVKAASAPRSRTSLKESWRMRPALSRIT